MFSQLNFFCKRKKPKQTCVFNYNYPESKREREHEEELTRESKSMFTYISLRIQFHSLTNRIFHVSFSFATSDSSGIHKKKKKNEWNSMNSMNFMNWLFFYSIYVCTSATLLFIYLRRWQYFIYSTNKWNCLNSTDYSIVTIHMHCLCVNPLILFFFFFFCQILHKYSVILSFN